MSPTYKFFHYPALRGKWKCGYSRHSSGCTEAFCLLSPPKLQSHVLQNLSLCLQLCCLDASVPCVCPKCYLFIYLDASWEPKLWNLKIGLKSLYVAGYVRKFVIAIASPLLAVQINLYYIRISDCFKIRHRPERSCSLSALLALQISPSFKSHAKITGSQ